MLPPCNQESNKGGNSGGSGGSNMIAKFISFLKKKCASNPMVLVAVVLSVWLVVRNMLQRVLR